MTEPRVRLRHDYVLPIGGLWSHAPCAFMVSADDEPYRTCGQLADHPVHQPAALDYDAALEDLTPAEALEVLMGAALAEATAHPRCFDCGTAHDPDPDACPKAEWQATP